VATTLRVAYTQQFSPKQTPLRKLLAVIRQHQGDRSKLQKAIGAAFFKAKASPVKLAGNTLISLRTYGIITDAAKLTPFGLDLADKKDDAGAFRALARQILLDLDGVAIMETLRELRSAGQKVSLNSLPGELEKRGFVATKNSSDLSGMLGWLRSAGVLSEYDVNETAYGELVGAEASQVTQIKGLTPDQLYFLRALVALGVADFAPHNKVVEHAQGLYPGETHYNWKAIHKTVLIPLVERGLIEIRDMKKSSATSRGGKPAEVRPTPKLQAAFSDRLLSSLAKAAGYGEFREIASKSWAEIVSQVESKDHNVSGKGLELLTIKIALTLDLEFMGWRTTDEALAGGAEVDAMLHSSRLLYSRWQVQCKASSHISLEAVAKEVGVAQITLANVVLIASTGTATKSAKTYRDQIIRSSNLNIVFLEGHHLKRIVADPSTIVGILNDQAREALRLKPRPSDLLGGPPPGSAPSAGGGSEPSGTAGSKSGGGVVSLAPAYSTGLGTMYHGDALDVLSALVSQGHRTKLIMTSPPFALLRKKAYGNEDADQYIQWFAEFVEVFKQILEPDGSLVIDIGGSWIRGLPVRSTYHFELLLHLCRSGFYLAQDFYHYNPARLPTPAEWVTVRRLRVKDAVNTVWWLVRDPFAPADNRQVLRPYSDSMLGLLKNGYRPRLRPSGHDISDKFQRDNGGAIPPNLITLANTESNSYYLTECRKHDLPPHPARFPRGLPEFFIKFLTKPGDVVLDPFAGSNVTGEAAELLGRRWLAIEINGDYVKGSEFRFTERDADDQRRSTVVRIRPDDLSLPFPA
jgi:site-specific DNA-methyltransferase (cytosine-N4-specific)